MSILVKGVQWPDVGGWRGGTKVVVQMNRALGTRVKAGAAPRVRSKRVSWEQPGCVGLVRLRLKRVGVLAPRACPAGGEVRSTV